VVRYYRFKAMREAAQRADEAAEAAGEVEILLTQTSRY
jgi:hypothetical protein